MWIARWIKPLRHGAHHLQSAIRACNRLLANLVIKGSDLDGVRNPKMKHDRPTEPVAITPTVWAPKWSNAHFWQLRVDYVLPQLKVGHFGSSAWGMSVYDSE